MLNLKYTILICKDWIHRHKTGLSIIVMVLALVAIFRFYEGAPDWARAIFTFFIWRQIGQSLSKVKPPNAGEVAMTKTAMDLILNAN